MGVDDLTTVTVPPSGPLESLFPRRGGGVGVAAVGRWDGGGFGYRGIRPYPFIDKRL
jgi:hypothetical protein